MKIHKVKLGLSALVGATFIVLIEIGLKGDMSATVTIRNNIAQFFSIDSNPVVGLFTVLGLIGIGTALCFIFKVNTMKKAFYQGASVLAIATTMIPNINYEPLKSSPNSELVRINLQTSDNKPVKDVLVTLWDARTNRIIGKSKYNGKTFSFYQTTGEYKIYVEVPGYNIEHSEFQVREGQQPVPISINLTPTFIPLILQRILK